MPAPSEQPPSPPVPRRGPRRKESEAGRAAFRIGANYTRLLATVFLGLLLNRIQLMGAGQSAFGLIALLGSTVGIAAMMKQIVRSCLVRELATVYHGDDPAEFDRTYNSAFLVAAVGAVIAVMVYAAIFVALPVMNIEPALMGAARWFIVAKVVDNVFVIIITPLRNMEVVSENVVASNFWKILDRASYVVCAAVIWILLGVSKPAQGVIAFGLSTAAISILLETIRGLMQVRQNPRLLPHLRLAERATAGDILRSSGWNAATLLANNLHLRADAIITNIAFGLTVSAAWAQAMILSSYVRMLTMGVTDGIDAVAARISLTRKHSAVLELLRHSTRINSFIAMPSGVAVFVLAQPILVAWIGQNAKARLTPDMIPNATLFMQVITIGVTIRALADNWLRILYGAGFIKRYAGSQLLAGLCNPILAVILLAVLPRDTMLRLGSAAYAFAIVHIAFHLLWVPRHVSSLLHLSYWSVLRPAVPCAILSLVTMPVLLVGQTYIGVSSAWRLMIVLGAYGAVYGALCFVLAATGDERRRLFRGVQDTLNRTGKRGRKHRRTRGQPPIIEPDSPLRESSTEA